MTKKGFDKEKPAAPMLPERTVTVPEIGEISRPPTSRPPMWVWIILFVIAVVALLVIMIRSGARQIGMGGMFIMPIMLVSMLMMLRNRAGGSNEKTRPAALMQKRVEYHRKLDELRTDVHEGAREQAGEIAYHHPNPANGSLLTLVGTGRMWERRPVDKNFGHVRMGLGLTRLQTHIAPPNNVPPPEYRETSTAIAARDFMLSQNVVHDVARPLHLFDQMGWCFLAAEEQQRPAIQGCLRSIVSQLCMFHGPDVVRLAIITDDLQAWQWCKWLPHAADPELVDASGPLRMIYADVSEFLERFGDVINGRGPWSPPVEGAQKPDDYWVIVVDMPGANCAPLLGVDGGGVAGVSVLEATGEHQFSPLATSATVFTLDDVGNLLRAKEVM